MKKRLTMLAVAGAVVLAIVAAPTFASGTYHVKYDFETPWTGDYAPGWNDAHAAVGDAPRTTMMEFAYFGYQGGTSMRVVALNAPDGAYNADVTPIGYDEAAMAKEYDPWVKVMYYDEGFNSEASYSSTLHRAGQMFAMPDTPAGSVGNDVQLGAGISNGDYYYHANTDAGGAYVAATDVDRVNGWHELMMQLSSVDGKIHFYIDGAEVGTTSRSDYDNLIGFGLSTMFTPSLSDWPHNNPSTVWDDFEFGSSYVPEPMTLGLLGLGSLVVLRRRRK